MILSIFVYVTAMSVFGWSFTTIIPVVAKNIFFADAKGMGYMFSAIGIGAIVATLFVSLVVKKFGKLITVVLGNILFSLSLFLFSLTTNLYLGIFYLFLAGAGLISINVVLFIIVQTISAEKFRGRVSSIYYLLYSGVIFLGNLEIGFITEVFGGGTALRINTLIVLLISIFIYQTRTRLRNAQKEYLSHSSIASV